MKVNNWLPNIMENVCLTSRRTDFKFLVIVGCIIVALMAAAALKFWALQPFHAAGYSMVIGHFTTQPDTDDTDAAVIRRDWPYRLVQPEWVNRTPDLFTNWTNDETAARSVVVGVGWLIVTGLLIHTYIRLSKETPMKSTATAHSIHPSKTPKPL